MSDPTVIIVGSGIGGLTNTSSSMPATHPGMAYPTNTMMEDRAAH